MAAILTGLHQSLSAEFGIPTDIRFLFKKNGVDGSTNIEEINAHKSILALASDVFKKGFYGGLEDHGSIYITDVTKEAFEAMIHFIYDKETNVLNYDFDMLCSLYYLADKYNITALEKGALKVIKSKEISVENVIDVGVLAIQYAVHDKLANTLYEACAQRLLRLFNGKLSEAIKYLSEIDADDSLDLIRFKSLMKIMSRLRDMEAAWCSNCKAIPCISGERLSRHNFVQGAKIVAYTVKGLDSIDHCSELCGGGDRKSFNGVDKNGETWTCTLRYYKFKC